MRVTVVRWRTGQLEALGHFENGNFRYIFVGPVAEDFGQKNDILENFSRNRFGSCPGHSSILSCRRIMCLKNERRSIGNPMSAFAQPKAASPSLREYSNRHANEIF